MFYGSFIDIFIASNLNKFTIFIEIISIFGWGWQLYMFDENNNLLEYVIFDDVTIEWSRGCIQRMFNIFTFFPNYILLKL